MRITVGLANFKDFGGSYFTQAALRLYHQAAMRNGEVVIVDNAPDSADGRLLADLRAQWGGGPVPLRYVPFIAATGTAAPRDEVFRQAKGDIVVCVDSHVLLAPGALDALLAFYDARPGCPDLVQGPMLYDDGAGYSTHFDDVWRGEMWGTWGVDPRGADPAGEPFEIPAMGLGLFACRRESWLGFHPAFRGFGGEEWYIHEKYRKAGRRTWCLPALRWMHRFGRPGGVPYPLARRDKVRNYVLGHRELGMPLDRCRNHFVSEAGMPAAEFDTVVAEADGVVATPAPQATQAGGCGCKAGSSPGLPPQPQAPVGYGEWLERTAKHDPPVLELKTLAEGVSRVVEYAAVRSGPSIAFLVAGPQSILSHAANTPPQADGHTRVEGGTTVVLGAKAAADATPESCDLLYLGERYDADSVYAALLRHAPECRGRVVIGEMAGREETAGGRPGVMPGVRRFLAERPEWTVLRRWKEGRGYLAITRLASDKKQPPPAWQQGWNVLKAAWRAGANVTNLGPAVGSGLQERRLELCTVCPARNGESCGSCGCNLSLKTSWPTESCPDGQWHAAE